MSKRSINWKRLGVMATLFALGIVVFIYKDPAKLIIKGILESSWPAFTLWLSALIGMAVKLCTENPEQPLKTGFIYESFGRYADAIFTVATYGLSGSTSLALLKGLHLQTFFGSDYFTGFGAFDLASIFLISSFLLYYSSVGISKLILNILFQAEAVNVAPA